jgi:hypothetical protein
MVGKQPQAGQAEFLPEFPDLNFRSVSSTKTGGSSAMVGFFLWTGFLAALAFVAVFLAAMGILSRKRI